MLKSSKVHPLSQDHQWPRHSKRVSETPCALVWNPRTHHLRSRPLLHVTLLQNPMPKSRHKTKPVHGVPSKNRQTDRTDECLGGTIPTSVGHGQAKQLGKATPYSRIHPQLLET